jgi:hypothetical protein
MEACMSAQALVCKLFFRVFVLAVASTGNLMCGLALGAPPRAASLSDALFLQQQGTTTNDWSRTQAFDLDNPIEVHAKVLRVIVEDGKHATIVYKFPTAVRGQKDTPVNPDAVYRAILQSSEEVSRLRTPLQRLSQGADVTLIGWPATGQNFDSSAMLIDEIVFPTDGTQLRFHEDNQALRARVQGSPNQAIEESAASS